VSVANLSSDRDKVLDATDLVALVGEHVALKPKGREHVGLCPFHDDRSPSMAVVTHKGGAFYKCFACGAGGNAIDFVMNFHKMGFGDALRYLAGRAGIELQQRQERDRDDGGLRKDDLYRANQLALKMYRRLLADPAEGAAARRVLEERRIAPASIEAFQIGYAPDRRDAIEDALQRATRHLRSTGAGLRDGPPSIEAFLAAGVVREGKHGRADLLRHRIVFPICDELGRPIAFGGRKIRDEDEPKYLNSPESPIFHKGRSLYGIHLAKQAIVKERTAIVTEGYTDVIACHAAGITNVVATLGTALTKEHARLLRRLCDTVILLFDGDAAGMRAADRGVEVFFAETIDVKVCTLPDDLDPDELLRLPNGADRFRAAMHASVDALAYLVGRFRSDYLGRTGMSGRQQALEALLRKLGELGFGALSGVRRQFVLASLATLTGLREQDLEQAFKAARPPERRLQPAVTAEAKSDEPSERNLEPFGGEPPAIDEDDGEIGRARREAERTLLALLLDHPDAWKDSFEVADLDAPPTAPKIALQLPEAVVPGWFRVGLHRSLYRTWHEIAESGRTPTLQRVLAELADQRLKGLASDLYVLGEQLRGKDDVATGRSVPELLRERLQGAISDLERLERRERDRAFDSSTHRFSPQPPPIAQTLVDAPPDSTPIACPTSTTDQNERSTPAAPASGRTTSNAAAAFEERLRLLRERGADPTRIPRPTRR
jgi:DNA primase